MNNMGAHIASIGGVSLPPSLGAVSNDCFGRIPIPTGLSAKTKRHKRTLASLYLDDTHRFEVTDTMAQYAGFG
jgi:hypothetical protein